MLKDLWATVGHIRRHPFNRGRVLSAIGRYLRWQVGSRLALGPVVVDFVDDIKLCVSPGMTGATGNVYSGLHEFDDMAFVLHALRPGDVFVDVGANVGSYSLLAAATGAEVFAFEPIPATFDQLRMNIRINDLADRVAASRAAVGRHRDTALFTAEQDTMNHIATAGESDASVEVAVVPLDEVFGPAPKAGPTLIKIDVEGYETEVIAGADATMSEPRLMAVIMELNGSGQRYGFDEEALHARMLAYGFRPFQYDGFTRAFTPLVGLNPNLGNTLYIRDFARIQQRAIDSRRYLVQKRLI